MLQRDRIDKKFQSTLYWACEYLSMPQSKLACISKIGPVRDSVKENADGITDSFMVLGIYTYSKTTFSV